jgi:hypothetical protein
LFTESRSWLRHCATIHKVAVSIPDGVFGTLQRLNLSGHIMALRSTQLLTEMSTRNISWGGGGGGGKGSWCVGLTTLQPECANCLEIWEPQPPGTLWSCNRPVQGLKNVLCIRHFAVTDCWTEFGNHLHYRVYNTANLINVHFTHHRLTNGGTHLLSKARG